MHPARGSGQGLLGSSGYDFGLAVAVDATGNSYLTGCVQGAMDGNPYAGAYDVFVAKYDTEGNKQWTKTLGTADEDRGEGIAVDAAGNSYITGYTRGDLDGNTCAGSADIFVAKYDGAGNKLWTKLFGNTGYDAGNDIAEDGAGNVYVTGITYTDYSEYIFLTKYDSSGTVQWTRRLGSRGYEYGTGIACGSRDNFYVTGATDGDLGGNVNGGSYDVFVWHLDYSKDGIALETVIRILQALTGTNPESIPLAADASGEGTVGLEDAIYFLK